jgi:TrmH family RNA methyltransferase
MNGSTPIRSRHNPLVRRLRELKARGPQEGLALLEGVKLIEEAVATGIEIAEAAVSPRLERMDRGRSLLIALESRAIAVRHLSDDVLESISEVETSQGILALARRPRFDEEPILAGTPLVLVAFAIQNPGNLGALLRTAEAARASGVYLTPGCADPFSSKALRGAMGSAFRLPHIRIDDAGALLLRLKKRGLVLLASTAENGRPHVQVDFTRPTALLVGNEGAGLPSAILDAVDERVVVPISSTVESLNVAVATGIMLFEAVRQRTSRS